MLHPFSVQRGRLLRTIEVIGNRPLGNFRYDHLQELRTDATELADIVKRVGQVGDDQLSFVWIDTLDLFSVLIYLIHFMFPIPPGIFDPPRARTSERRLHSD